LALGAKLGCLRAAQVSAEAWAAIPRLRRPPDGDLSRRSHGSAAGQTQGRQRERAARGGGAIEAVVRTVAAAGQPRLASEFTSACKARAVRRAIAASKALGYTELRRQQAPAAERHGVTKRGRWDNLGWLEMTSRSMRVLIVAYRTAATPLLLNAVRSRAARSPCSFTLLVPRPYWDPDTEEAEVTLELAIPLLEESAGGRVEGVVGDPDPFVAVRDAVTSIGIDEIIVSTLPARVSRWLRLDLPHRVGQFGLPVTVVTARQSERALWSTAICFSPSAAMISPHWWP
jgi:hypothetical protein